MEAEAGELTVGDVERLLALYKEVVTKYSSLCNNVGYFSISRRRPLLHELTRDSSILADKKYSSSAVSKERGNLLFIYLYMSFWNQNSVFMLIYSQEMRQKIRKEVMFLFLFHLIT